MLKLNLGCGTDHHQDCVNIDIRAVSGVDLICDIRELPYKPEEVDEIRAYDVLEHFPYAQVPKIITKWIDLLKKGGLIIARVPDLEKILAALLKSSLPVFEAQRLVFGGQDHEYNFHSTGFSQGLLEGLLLGCGCSEVIQVIRDDKDYNVTLVARK